MTCNNAGDVRYLENLLNLTSIPFEGGDWGRYGRDASNQSAQCAVGSQSVTRATPEEGQKNKANAKSVYLYIPFEGGDWGRYKANKANAKEFTKRK